MIPRMYLIAAAVLIVLGVGATVAVKAYHLGIDHQLAEDQKAIEEAQKKAQDADDRYRNGQAEAETYRATVAQLLTRVPVNPKELIHDVPTTAPVTSCPDRSTAYRLQFNAIAQGAAGIPSPAR